MDIFQLPFRIYEWNEEGLVGLDRNLKELERVLSQLQAYELQYGRPANEKLANVLDPDGNLLTSKLNEKMVGLENELKIANLAVDNAKLAVAAVLEANLGDDAVTAGKIAANAVTAVKIAANAVTASKIKAGEITADKMNVNELSAISAVLGTITSGSIYSGLFQTNTSGAEAYIALTTNDELVVIYDEEEQLKIKADNHGGSIRFKYDGTDHAEIFVDDTVAYFDAVEKQLRLSVKNTHGTRVSWINIRRYSGDDDYSIALVTELSDGEVSMDTTHTKVFGDFSVHSGTKSAVVETKNYGSRRLIARESPVTRFIDDGISHIKDGEGIISLDPIFLETIKPHTDEFPWIVHITPYGNYNVYVDKIHNNSVIVKSSAKTNGQFAWSLSGVGFHCDGIRLQQEESFSESAENAMSKCLNDEWEGDYLEE